MKTGFKRKADFFKGGYFLITLSAFEKEKKILVPGHRFLPFLNPMVMPWNIKITSQNGVPLKQITEQAHLATLKPLYSLSGEENLLFLLMADKEGNSKIVLENESHFSHHFYFTAYDLSPLFENEDTTHALFNLSLILKINDWEKGIYTVHIKSANKNNDNAAEWIKKLEKGFKTVFSSKKKLLMVPEVMSDAFMHGGKVLLENPLISLEDFFEISEVNSISDTISQYKEDPVLVEKKNFIREKTLSLLKTFTAWLEHNDENDKTNRETVKILEKQILVTKKTLIAVLEEIYNPFLTEDMINTILQVITESEKLVSKIK